MATLWGNCSNFQHPQKGRAGPVRGDLNISKSLFFHTVEFVFVTTKQETDMKDCYCEIGIK